MADNGIPLQHPARDTRRWRVFLSFLGLFVLILLGAAWQMGSVYRHSRAHAVGDLKTIVGFKLREATRWIGEETRHLAQLQNGRLATAAIHWLSEGAPPGPGRELAARLEALRVGEPDGPGIILVDTAGRPQLSTREASLARTGALSAALAEAYAGRKPVLVRSGSSGRASDTKLAFVVPLISGQPGGLRPVGALIYEIDPGKSLFPIMGEWPHASQTERILVFRRQGDRIIGLYSSRHRGGGALPTPVLGLNLAGLDRDAVVEYRDDHGVDVIGAVGAIPHMGWYLMAGRARSEVYANARLNIMTMMGVTLFTLATLAVIFRLMRRNENARREADRLAAEMTRQRLEKHFDFLVRYGRDIVLLVDAAGDLLDANEAAVRAYGYDRDTLLQLNLRDLRAPESVDQLYSQVDAVSAGEGASFETQHRRRDGSTFPVEVSIHGFDNDSRHYKHYIMRDITTRKQAETERQRVARRTEGLLEMAGADENLDERQLIQYGVEMAERLTDSRAAFLHFVQDDQESIELFAWSAATLSQCQAVHDSHYPIAQAGIWADCFRKRVPVVYNDYPGTPEKRGLPEGHTTLQRLISVPVVEGGGVRIILGVGNKPSDYDAMDVETAQLIGNDLWRMVRRLRAEQALRENLEHQVQLNRKLEEAHNQLLQSEKLAAIGQLAAGLAHEVNNPVGFVYSNLGTLEGYVRDILEIMAACEATSQSVAADHPDLERIRQLRKEKDYDFVREDLPKLLAESREGLDRVRKIVQDLKDFSRSGHDDWQWADLHKGLDSTLNIVWNELKYKCEVVKHYGTLPEVYCLPSQLNQVFMNLLVNAGQAIEEKGVITLRTGVDDDRVWVEVGDTGQGIPKDRLNRIFEPFFTTKPVGKGTGLGLSLSYSIVQRHQGSLEVVSEPGAGSTFRVVLPVRPSDAPEEAG